MTIELKICGLTTLHDMRLCESIGADYVGMVVEVPYSRRWIDRQAARYLCQAARARPVLVIAAQPIQEVIEIARLCQPAALQMHGSEKLSDLARLVEELSPDIQTWCGLGLAPTGEEQPRTVEENVELIQQLTDIGVSRIVLDTVTKDEMGGTGVTGDWRTAAAIISQSALPIMLAGGLSPDNVVEAVRATNPAGVDLATGVEREPGRKDPRKVRALAAALQQLSPEAI